MRIVGDCREVLRDLPDGSVQTCVTSPPYWGLRDYGVKPLVWGGEPSCAHKWGETIAVNATNHTDKRRWNHTRNGRDEEQPTEKRVAWLRTAVNQGNFCQKCGAWSGSLGLEPTPELYVEHIVEGFREVRRVLADDGTLWLNLGDCYATGAGKVGQHPGGGAQGERWAGRGTHTAENSGKAAARIKAMGPMTQPNRMPIAGLKPKDLVGMPWRVAFALQADGYFLRSDVIWAKPNAMPESVTDRPTRSHEYLFLFSKRERYFYDHEAIKEPAKLLERAIARSGNKRRKYDMEHGRPGGHNAHSIPWEGFTRNKRTVWTVNAKGFKGAHFATFPPALVEPCILAGSRPGSQILDPFAGVGTVGMVAEQLGRRFIGIELNPAYSKLAREAT